ncbi:hypothetical protein DFH11DRAFT_1657673 [Phellopilus nigrolimitatus]|nr:hypothetical protein DFH11DRAFT_1657673 [Phellopilus nigrolimitatus]
MLATRRLQSARACRKNVCMVPACQTSSRSKSTLLEPQSSNAASAIPKAPTWSVHELISSYPRPSIAPATLKKLHELSALVPPTEGTEEHARTQRELEEMVRLVEAVKLVDARQALTGGSDVSEEGIPDGRIWPADVGMTLSSNTRAVEFEDAEVESGKELLKHAAWTKDGFYVVEVDRRRK